MTVAEFSDEWILDRAIPVPESGCWLWTGGEATGGYGKGWRAGRTVLAHRAAWEAKHGTLPKTVVVCHKCDTRLCVNTDHMFAGSHKDNTDDMVRKGRQAVGERSGNSKLTNEIVLAIRAETGSIASIARKYGLKECNTRLVLYGVTWKHLL